MYLKSQTEFPLLGQKEKALSQRICDHFSYQWHRNTHSHTGRTTHTHTVHTSLFCVVYLQAFVRIIASIEDLWTLRSVWDHKALSCLCGFLISSDSLEKDTFMNPILSHFDAHDNPILNLFSPSISVIIFLLFWSKWPFSDHSPSVHL